MDSRKIADVLESEYPDPALHLESPYQARIEALVGKLLGQIMPIFVPLVPKVFLNPASQKYYVPSRETSLGMALDEYHKGADQALDQARPTIKQIGDMLDENASGPYLQGQEPCYADFIVVSWIRMMDGLGWAETFLACDGGQQIKRLYEASAKWLERDSY
ncbi:hypothetical protein A1O1_05814 [Capronia coronata CBS 617.96]|uniref:Glutathione S-transferase UstS-like C-terminal domain-containing protein n=1 Tax=Capronia coronata CBS 617.96 TaxID=1182541 RepID=W9Y754_9EURO|nr:uncharacterized protein A1O1_05814 [Capronia coronata CBS 617.96]EXJ85450.1 hypothetical protein A1O1_05814 [Capronia coronata CBS 617.96]